MFSRKIFTKTLVLSAACLSLGSLLQAAPEIAGRQRIAKDGDQQFVTPAQAFLQGTDTITPQVNQPVPFQTVNLEKHIKIKDHNSVFKVKVGGLYTIEASLMLIFPSSGGATGVIAINGHKFLNFQGKAIVGFGPTFVADLAVSAELYLKEDDEVSVVLTSVPTGTVVTDRTLNMFVVNNTKD